MNATERLLKAIEQLHDSEHRLRGLPARLQQRRLGKLASRVFDEIVGEIEHDIRVRVHQTRKSGEFALPEIRSRRWRR